MAVRAEGKKTNADMLSDVKVAPKGTAPCTNLRVCDNTNQAKNTTKTMMEKTPPHCPRNAGQ